MSDVSVRDVLMVGYLVAWLFVVALTAWRTGTVPAELWAVLSIGEGAIMAVFRAEDVLRRRPGDGRDDE